MEGKQSTTKQSQITGYLVRKKTAVPKLSASRTGSKKKAAPLVINLEDDGSYALPVVNLKREPRPPLGLSVVLRDEESFMKGARLSVDKLLEDGKASSIIRGETEICNGYSVVLESGMLVVRSLETEMLSYFCMETGCTKAPEIELLTCDIHMNQAYKGTGMLDNEVIQQADGLEQLSEDIGTSLSISDDGADSWEDVDDSDEENDNDQSSNQSMPLHAISETTTNTDGNMKENSFSGGIDEDERDPNNPEVGESVLEMPPITTTDREAIKAAKKKLRIQSLQLVGKMKD